MSTTRALEHAIQHVKNGSTVELTTDDVLSMWGLVRAARLDELERENAALREALKPFAAQTRVSSLTEEKMIRAARAALAGSGEK